VSGGDYIVVGAAITAVAGLGAVAVERSWRRLEEFEGAAAAWLAAIDWYVLLLSTLPKLPSGTKPVDRWIDRLTNKFQEHTGSWVIPVAQAWLFWPINRRVELATQNLWEATNRFLLLAPARVRRALDPIVDLIGEGTTRVGDPTLLEQWTTEVKPVVVDAIRNGMRPRWLPRRPRRADRAATTPTA
jgi:hypothetical protein